MENNNVDLTKIVQYDEVDRKINVILDVLFHDFKISEKKVREFEKLLETFVNKISGNSGRTANNEFSEKEYNRKRKEEYKPLINYLSTFSEKELSNEQCVIIIDTHVLNLEIEINENINKSYKKWTLEESISRKWQ